MQPRRIQIVLADSHEMFLDSLAARIAQEPGFHVVGTATTTAALGALIAEHRPDIALMDMETPGSGALFLAAEISKQQSQTRVVFLSAYVADILVAHALRVGAAGYLLKSDRVESLLESLERVFEGQQRFSSNVATRLSFDHKRRAFVPSVEYLESLSTRQVEILRQIARGKTVKAVAKALGQSERAVEGMKFRMMRFLRIHDRVELARFAIREGLITP